VHPKGAYFTRGSGHNEAAGYTEDAGDYERLMERLKRKFATAAALVPGPVLKRAEKRATLGLISVGSCDDAVGEARDRLQDEGIHGDYLRIRAFPFNEAVQAFLDEHERIFVIEQNRDGQLRSLLINECNVDGRRLESILHYDGLPMAAAPLVAAVRERVRKGAAA
jgi:2-oxoglutarate/2-oxoacid ferredoxin oxidoreductase subunit alpha